MAGEFAGRQQLLRFRRAGRVPLAIVGGSGFIDQSCGKERKDGGDPIGRDAPSPFADRYVACVLHLRGPHRNSLRVCEFFGGGIAFSVAAGMKEAAEVW
ncbi:MAG: hypothetical protein ACREQI_16315 [Candidatus Binataceae bacterium]